MAETKRLIIIDSNSIIHRAFHALPPLSNKKGEQLGAVYGFLLVFFKALKDFQPDFIAATFDFPAPTFRHKKYKEYKAKRPPAPKELYQQIPKVKEVLRVFGVQIFEKEGFEADDIIGTIAVLAPKKQVLPEVETIILSGDLDALQLVNPQTKVYALRKGVKDVVLYDEGLVEEKFQGLKAKQVLDYKALRGDPSDNIPGVTGIGEKTAIELILKFGSAENLYKEIEENSEKARELRPKLKETLIQYKEQAFLSKDLAQIDRNVPIGFNLEKCHWLGYNKEKANQVLKNFEFYSLIKRLPDIGGQKKQGLIGRNLSLW
ncbi:MAG: 5'-3' exonuclease H3TH domain-containing protein [bacterium]